jgi:predicted nucleic acid-binding protein
VRPQSQAKPLLPDVNVVVASVRGDHPHHGSAYDALASRVAIGKPLVVPIEVLASTMRVLMLDIWVNPETSASAALLMRSWVRSTGATVLGHPTAAFAILAEFARTLDLSPRRMPDALLAASAIALRATLLSFDKGFAGYPGLSSMILDP